MRWARAVRCVQWTAVTMLSTLCLASPASPAQLASDATGATAVERGKNTFDTHCAVCHGKRGKGNGPATLALKQRPTNLRIMARRAGTFPAQQVEAAIRGTNPALAHGVPGMLVWNAMFLGDADGDQAAADARISDLVKFIESIQVK